MIACRVLTALRIHRRQEGPEKGVEILLANLERVISQNTSITRGIAVAFDAADLELEAEVLRRYAASTSNLRLGPQKDETRGFFTQKDYIRSSYKAFDVMELEIPLYLVPVKPWGAYVAALNALLMVAAKEGYDQILYQSLEVRLSKIDIIVMSTLCFPDERNVLVVGREFPGSHCIAGENQKTIRENADTVPVKIIEHLGKLVNIYASDQLALSGLSSPWNTAAIWNVKSLCKTGFSLISDGLIEGIEPGIEEGTVIALHQKLLPETSRALLLHFEFGNRQDDLLLWNQTWSDEKRLAYHKWKMDSKIVRSKLQRDALGLFVDSNTVELFTAVLT